MNDFDNKVKEIIKFISKSDKKTIKNKLHNILEYNKFCPIILGQGAFGKAYIPESKNIEVNIDGKKVYLPIVSVFFWFHYSIINIFDVVHLN